MRLSLPSLAVAVAAASTPAVLRVHGDLLASTAKWPSLQLHFKLKRSSMKVHGEVEFDMYANPVVSPNGTEVMYDGYTEFTEGSTVYKYTVLDGLAYLSSGSPTGQAKQTESLTECLDVKSLPPLNDVLSALNDATAASNVTSADSVVKCNPGHLFKVSLGGSTLALCASGSEGVHIYGSDLDITIRYLKTAVNISTPSMNTDAKSECEWVVNTTSVTATTVAFLTGEEIPSSEERDAGTGENIKLNPSSCKCKSTPRPCVFIHGLGISYEKPGLQDSFSDYWGNLTEHAPCCTSFKYAIMDTIHNAWTNRIQQQKVCDYAVEASPSSTPTVISDTIIVTHSMGGLTLAAAIANGLCSLDSSVSWAATSAPMMGSMASDFMQRTCAGDNGLLESVANLFGQCPPNASTISLSYEKESYSTTELDDAYAEARLAYQTNVTAAMCSDSYSGIASVYQAMYWLGGVMIPHKSDANDGMVEFQSCAGGLPMDEFGADYHDQFYVTHLNHADTTFYNGDALFKAYKKPVKWFECLL